MIQSQAQGNGSRNSGISSLCPTVSESLVTSEKFWNPWVLLLQNEETMCSSQSVAVERGGQTRRWELDVRHLVRASQPVKQHRR